MDTKYKNTSVYKNTKINNTYLDIYQPPIIPNFKNVKEIKLSAKYHRRPDLLAFDLYGESSLWWVFTLYNRNIINDPLFDFINGLTILAPRSINEIGL